MKIEIDFSRPEELRKMKQEFEIAIATIESALSALSVKTESPNQLKIALPGPVFSTPYPFVAETSSTIDAALNRMPNEFTFVTLKPVAEELNIPESRVRKIIPELIKTGKLILVEQGQGRRPSVYRKA